MPKQLTRREFLRQASSVGALALVPGLSLKDLLSQKPRWVRLAVQAEGSLDEMLQDRYYTRHTVREKICDAVSYNSAMFQEKKASDDKLYEAVTSTIDALRASCTAGIYRSIDDPSQEVRYDFDYYRGVLYRDLGFMLYCFHLVPLTDDFAHNMDGFDRKALDATLHYSDKALEILTRACALDPDNRRKERILINTDQFRDSLVKFGSYHFQSTRAEQKREK